MSANNYIVINFKKKTVEHRYADNNHIIGKKKKFKTPTEAILQAVELWDEWDPVEYGVWFEEVGELKKENL